MINIFVLEDEILQQSRIENAINIALKRNSLKCRSINIFGKPQQLLDAIVELINYSF